MNMKITDAIEALEQMKKKAAYLNELEALILATKILTVVKDLKSILENNK